MERFQQLLIYCCDDAKYVNKLNRKGCKHTVSCLEMDFKSAIEPVLKKHSLVAFLINDGWLQIRRRVYIDMYIQRQPFNSVEILFHVETKVKLTSVFGILFGWLIFSVITEYCGPYLGQNSSP